MKFQKIDEGFCVLPNIDIVWVPWVDKTNNTFYIWDIRFSWLRWMFTTEKIINFLNKNHYN